MINKNQSVKFLPTNPLMQKTVSCHHLPRLRVAYAASCFRVFTGGKGTLRYPQSLTAAKNMTTKPDSTKTVWSRAICEQFFTCCGLDNRNIIDKKGKGASRLVRE